MFIVTYYILIKYILPRIFSINLIFSCMYHIPWYTNEFSIKFIYEGRQSLPLEGSSAQRKISNIKYKDQDQEQYLQSGFSIRVKSQNF